MSRAHTNRKLGFTLIELMIVVAILGILAAVAIPSFATYIRRSKTADAYSTLDAMFKALSVYYNRDFASSGAIVSNIVGHCTVLEADTFPGAPKDYKQPFVSSPSFSMETGIALPTGASYYKFTNRGGTTGCGKPASAVHYTLTAIGDLDADAETSMFSTLVAASSANELYRAGTVFVIDELE